MQFWPDLQDASSSLCMLSLNSIHAQIANLSTLSGAVFTDIDHIIQFQTLQLHVYCQVHAEYKIHDVQDCASSYNMAGDIKCKRAIQKLHVQFSGTIGCSGSW